MEKFQSLAEYLGTKAKDTDTAPASTATSPLRKVSVETFCREVLNSPEYRQSIRNRITLGILPAQVECLMYHYAHGKPVEKVEVKDDRSSALETMTVEQLESRALFLADVARRMREQANEDDDGEVVRETIN